jgi:hypothetical protein
MPKRNQWVTNSFLSNPQHEFLKRARFAHYFGTADGGTFLLSATFSVTRNVSQITHVQATFSNSAGTSTTPPISLE